VPAAPAYNRRHMKIVAPAGPRIASALAYGVLAVLWAAPSSLSPTNTIPDLGDPLHLSWVMAWDAHQIIRRPWALFESNSFYPYPRSLTFGDHLLPEALLVAPVQWLTHNAVLASNLAVLLALFLSAFGMFLVVQEVTGSGAAAFGAGLSYAFNSFTEAETLRVQVLNIQWWPLAILFLIRFAREGHRRDARLFAGALLLQGLSGAYYLVYCVMLLPVWLLAAFWKRGGSGELRALALPLAVTGAIAVPVLWPYVVQLRAMGFEKELHEGVDLLSFVSAVPGGLLGRFQIGVLRGEAPHFLGVVGAVLMVVGAVRVFGGRLGPSARILGILALTTATLGLLLSLGPVVRAGGVPLVGGPYALLYRFVPLSRGMSSPVRTVVLVILGGSLLLGLALARVSERFGRLPALVLALLLPLEQWSPPRTGTPVPTGDEVPRVYRFLAQDSQEPMVDLPLYPDVAKRFWATYMYFSTYHWRPIPIGRTSFYPPAHDYLAWSLRDFPDDLSVRILDGLGIRTLVVHPFIWEDGEDRARRLDALDHDPRLRLVQRFDELPQARFSPLELGQERVYRILSSDSPLPQPCTPEAEIPRTGWRLHATGNARPELAIDGDRHTAWYAGPPQRPGDRFEVLLPAPETIAAVAIEMWYPHTEFPRNLVLVGREADGPWHRVSYADGPAERLALLHDLIERPRDARMILRIAPERLSALRLAVGWRESSGAWPAWSIPELRIYGECR
jgi:hypothetical protein